MDGHGFFIATYLGTELGLLISGEKERNPFQEITFQTMFFYRNKQCFFLRHAVITACLTGYHKSFIRFPLRKKR
ncbi:uncharacterized protein METZ01_LOCUS71055 [marine metagenome]|uniref:Uncharacterized protein n=1 Tax=marine metagenome TaxID=408172 RepID=A0A381TRW5_9ZZZZ